MKLLAVEFTLQLRYPQVPNGRTITGQTSQILAGDWLLDFDDGTGYVSVAHKDHPEAVTAYSPAVVRLVRFAPPPEKKGK